MSEIVVAVTNAAQVFHGDQQVVFILYRQYEDRNGGLNEEFLVAPWGGEKRPSYWVERQELTFR